MQTQPSLALEELNRVLEHLGHIPRAPWARKLGDVALVVSDLLPPTLDAVYIPLDCPPMPGVLNLDQPTVVVRPWVVQAGEELHIPEQDLAAFLAWRVESEADRRYRPKPLADWAAWGREGSWFDEEWDHHP